MSGFVFYRGPSEIDGAPIIAIATLESRNTANGAMVQTWIMRDDQHPVEALHNGDNASVCGGCTHQGKYDQDRKEWKAARTCYVMPQAFSGVYKTWLKGSAAVEPYEDLSADPDAAAKRVADRLVRLGAYGDPAAVPHGVWRGFIARAKGHTGYTHQWRTHPQLADLCMASVDSIEEREEAKAAGWRTFRVAALANWVRAYREALCPKSEEAKAQRGVAVTCDACMACDGMARGKPAADIVIPAHGTAKRLVRG